MKNKQPLVSIVMPVYNAGGYLVDALNSILDQTYENTEFIIVDDASTDGSYDILQGYAARHKKITLIHNTKNMGISETVKKALRHAKGEFIARMDADDISMPNRIEKQVAYLLDNEQTVAVGAQCLLIDRRNKVIGKKSFPTAFEDIYRYSFQFVPVQQPTLMIAKKRLPKGFEYYRDGMNTAEEVELFFKLFQYGKVENVPDTLLMYRMHDTNTSFANLRQTFFLTLIARIKAVYVYGYKPNATGMIVTFLQAILTLCLPQAVTLSMYKFMRNMQSDKAIFQHPIKALSPQFARSV